MIRPDIEGAIARANKATPDPWVRQDADGEPTSGVGYRIAAGSFERNLIAAESRHDATFIAAARTDALAIGAYALELEDKARTLIRERGDDEVARREQVARAEAAEARVRELELMISGPDSPVLIGTAWSWAEQKGAAAERAAIIAEAVGTANGIVIDGTHSVDYWCGFRDALESFARNLAIESGAHLPAATEGE